MMNMLLILLTSNGWSTDTHVQHQQLLSSADLLVIYIRKENSRKMNESVDERNLTFGVAKPLISDKILIPIGTLIIIENFISFIVLLRCNRLKSQIRILNINLCLSDLSMGIFLTIPIQTLSFGGTCIVRKYFTAMFIHVTLLIITMFNVDRCCVLHFGANYHLYITKLSLAVVSTLIWVIALISSFGRFYDTTTSTGISCQPVFAAEENHVTLLVNWVLALIVVLNFVMFVYFVCYVKKRFIRVYGTTNNDNDQLAPSSQIRLLGKVSVITCLFIFTYFPYLLTTLFPLLDYTTQSGRTIHTVLLTILMINSAINPFLYILRFREALYHCKQLLCFWNKRYLRKVHRQYKENVSSYGIELKKTCR